MPIQFYFASAGNVTWNGVYVNPYTRRSTIHSRALENPLTVYCDDWNTDFSGNPTWNADVYALTAANLPNFKYANPTSDYTLALNSGTLVATLETDRPAWSPLQRYLEAALDSMETVAGYHGDERATYDTQVETGRGKWTLFVDAAHVGMVWSGLVGAINSSGYATEVFDYLQEAEDAVTAGTRRRAGMSSCR